MPTNEIASIVARRVLPQMASILVEAAKSIAPTTRIKNSFKIGDVIDMGNSVYAIDITNDAPEAGAYEFGSGLFGTKGPREKYIIRAKNARVLAFLMPEALNIDRPVIGINPETGKVFFKEVKHPGVKPNAFVYKAYIQKKKEISQLAGRSFVVEVFYKAIRGDYVD